MVVVFSKGEKGVSGTGQWAAYISGVRTSVIRPCKKVKPNMADIQVKLTYYSFNVVHSFSTSYPAKYSFVQASHS